MPVQEMLSYSQKEKLIALEEEGAVMKAKERALFKDQDWLPFEFVEEMKKSPDYTQLPRFDNAETDNKKLFNCQYEYYNGNRDVACREMYFILDKVAKRLIGVECKKRKLKFSKMQISEYASDAATYVIEQFLKNEVIVHTSFIAYLKLQVCKVLYSMTKGEKFEWWCKKNKQNLLGLDYYSREKLKQMFEQETGGEE